MAIATLAEVYNNPKVFTGVVKIRKGLAAKMILTSSTLEGLESWFHVLAKDIRKRVPPNDPNATSTISTCNKIIRRTAGGARATFIFNFASTLGWLSPIAIGVGYIGLYRSTTMVWNSNLLYSSGSLVDGMNATLIFGGSFYFIGYMLIMKFFHYMSV